MSEVYELQMSVSVNGSALGSASLPGLSVTRVDTACTPESIESGITCGMSDMCGEDPCLCGASDEFGCCACNGFETLYPEVTVTSSAGNVKPLHIGDSWYLVTLGSGETELTVDASLKHYTNAVVKAPLQVGGPSAGGIVCIAIVVVVIIAIIALAVRKVRARNCAPTEPAGEPCALESAPTELAEEEPADE